MKSTSQGTSRLAHQVRQEEERALQDADQQQAAALVVGGDLLAQRLHAVRELVLLDEDLSDRRVLHGGHATPAARTARSPADPRASAAKRSSSATPATQTISSPAHTTGQRAAQRPRHLAVGEQVLERLGATEPHRAHAVAVLPGADHERHATASARHRDLPGLDRAASTSQAPKRDDPGHAQLHRRGRGRLPAAPEAQHPVLLDGPQPVAEVQRGATRPPDPAPARRPPGRGTAE